MEHVNLNIVRGGEAEYEEVKTISLLMASVMLFVVLLLQCLAAARGLAASLS